MSKRILVTGGCGFLGAAVANWLADAGHRVTVLDDASRGDVRRLVEPNRFTVVRQDVRYARFGAKFDSVWHLAAVNGTVNFYKDPYRVLDVQLGGTLRVIDQCKKQDVGEIVLFSSSEVYQQAETIPTDESVPLSIPDPMNPRYSYAGSKIASELAVLHSGIERALVIRPHNVYGPDMGFDHVVPEFIMRMADCDGSFEIKGDPQSTRAFINVGDFIAGVMVAWRYGERRCIYHVGTEHEVSMNKLAVLVGLALARPVDSMLFIRGKGAEGGPARRCPDTRKLRALGWKPMIALSDGLSQTAEWMLAHRDLWPKEGA